MIASCAVQGRLLVVPMLARVIRAVHARRALSVKATVQFRRAQKERSPLPARTPAPSAAPTTSIPKMVSLTRARRVTLARSRAGEMLSLATCAAPVQQVPSVTVTIQLRPAQEGHFLLPARTPALLVARTTSTRRLAKPTGASLVLQARTQQYRARAGETRAQSAPQAPFATETAQRHCVLSVHIRQRVHHNAQSVVRIIGMRQNRDRRMPAMSALLALTRQARIAPTTQRPAILVMRATVAIVAMATASRCHASLAGLLELVKITVSIARLVECSPSRHRPLASTARTANTWTKQTEHFVMVRVARQVARPLASCVTRTALPTPITHTSRTRRRVPTTASRTTRARMSATRNAGVRRRLR